MSTSIPPVAEVRDALKSLTLKQIDALARLSGVAAPTIYKIKNGQTDNPGIETVRKFMPHIAAALATGGEPQQQGA